MTKRTLGLDIGPNSIGWAIVEGEGEAETRLVDLGVRVFPEGVDNFDTAKEVSRNEGRRVMRGMRRQTRRRTRRRKELHAALASVGLLPESDEELKQVLRLDPYALRARAVHEKLQPFELGRVFQHLGQRRGFLSNRKKDRGDKEVQGMLAEINNLSAEMASSTLGQLLHRKLQSLDHRNRIDGDNVRNRHTSRAMYQGEFERIWEAQRNLGHSKLLTDELKYGRGGDHDYPRRPKRRPRNLSLLQAYGVFGLLFFQRKMFWPKSVVGLCEFESKQPRCPRGDRHAQCFRVLQEVNNLLYLDPSAREECCLSQEQRTLLLAKLAEREHMTFDQIRTALGFLDSMRFNLERGNRSKLQGNVVDARLAKVLGKAWHNRPNEEKDRIVRTLLDNEREDETIRRVAVAEWGLTTRQAEDLLDVDLPSGYLDLSLKAIDKLMPHMERGMPYMRGAGVDARGNPTDAIHAAGYGRRDELQRRIFDKLPDPARTKNCPVGDLPNPVVRRALVELRNVVNAVIGLHGKPDEIHIEMGRDLKTRPKPGTESFRKYQDKIKADREREALRDDAAGKLRENRIKVTSASIVKYLLWRQQKCECIYSGRPISFAQLFGDHVEADIDHILPRSRTLDDSQMNKVVCFRVTPDKLGNHDKGDRTPYEWLAESRPQAYEAACQRAKQLPYPKYRRFLIKELKLDDFIERQLNDTRYIAKVAGEYLRCLCSHDHQVIGLKGELTHELRHQWGLDTLLAELPDSPAWHEQGSLTAGEKNRADHRHHAIDALLIALTDRRRLQQLSQMRKSGGVQATGECLPDPWDDFRRSVSAVVANIRVSQRAERRTKGRLHEETLYGRTPQPGQWVARKPIESLSPNEVERIRDEGIRRIVMARLAEHGIDVGRGKKVDAKLWKQALHDLRMPSGVPIKKVRVLKPELTVQPIRVNAPGQAYVKPGSMHHVAVFEWMEKGKTKRDAVFVSLLEATDRLKRHQPIVSRVHPVRPDARFVMSLSRGEMVLAQYRGQEKLLVFRTAASTQGQLYFAEHTDARKSDSYQKFVFKASTLNARKVTVDAAGRLRWAND